MIVSSWNCRGAGNRTFPNTLKHIVKQYHIDVMCLIETRISGSRADQVIRKLGFSNWIRLEAAGFTGGIWVLWNDNNTMIEYLSSSPQYIHCKMIDRNGGEEHLITFIYGETTYHKRRALWDALVLLAPNILTPWLVVGDFNAFLQETDKLGGSKPVVMSMLHFGECIRDAGLIDLPIVGERFTWEKQNVKERLDWAFSNIHWLMKYPQSKTFHNLRFKSDHRVIVITDGCSGRANTGYQQNFCYRAAWA